MEPGDAVQDPNRRGDDQEVPAENGEGKAEHRGEYGPSRSGGRGQGHKNVACRDCRMLSSLGPPRFEPFAAWPPRHLQVGHWPMVSAGEDLAMALVKLAAIDLGARRGGSCRDGRPIPV